MKTRIRTGDTVQVIAGAYKGTVGEILEIDREAQRVVVQGVNLVYRHTRPSRENPRGGRVSKEAPIHISNVMLYDPQLNRGVRVGLKTNEAGDKVRFSKKSGAEMGVWRRAKTESESETTES